MDKNEKFNNSSESLDSEESTEEEIQDNDELSCEELNEVMKYILLKDYFKII